MDNVQPKKSDDRKKNLPNEIKPEGIKRNVEYFDELGRPPLPKRPKDIKHSNAYDQILDTSEDKNHIFDNTDFGNNPREMRFDSLLDKDPSHTSYLKDHKIGKVIASDHEKVVYADHVVKSNSTKKDVHEISFRHTDDFFKIGFENDSCLEKDTTEIKAFKESSDKEFVEDSRVESLVPSTSAEEDAASDCPFGDISPKLEDEIQLNSQIFYPEKDRKKMEIFPRYSANFYNMQTFPRGKLIIINVKNLKKSSGNSNYICNETDRDAIGLQHLFLELGFIIERHDNPSTYDMEKVMRAAANEDYSKLSCFACAFLSRVEEGKICGTDGFMNIEGLTSLLRTKKLAGKPKLFIFQAYQKLKHMESYDSVDGGGGDEAGINVLDLPVEADFLFCYSTVKEYYARHHSESGSLFIQTLIEVFRSYAHEMDVVRMLTFVNSSIAVPMSQTDAAATNEKRKIVSIISQLRQELFLFPPFGPLQPKHGA